jgi:hypothetical protein
MLFLITPKTKKMALSTAFFNLDQLVSKCHRTSYLIIFMGLYLNFESQNEASKWYFGQSAALDFMTYPPGIITTNAGSSTIEGCASVADAAGNLLFYTNGVELWDKTNTYMAGGSFLAGGVSSTQSSLIVKKPGSSNLYYIFTTGAGGTGSLAYSAVDMNLAAGLGSVTVLNTILTGSVTEKLSGTMHCNGTDVWILAHKYNSDNFYAYLLTSNGVNTSPVISAVGTPHSATSATYNAACGGQMKISPSGKKIGVIIPKQIEVVEFLDFDPSLGNVSNPVTIPLLNLTYGGEFSPDGTKFYSEKASATVGYSILQWDLCAGSASAIAASQSTVSSSNFYIGAMQLGPFSKIYCTQPGTQVLASINSPNSLGSACNFSLNSFSIGTATCQQGLPNFITFPFREKAKASLHKTCGTASFSYTPPTYCANASYSVNSVQWSFGDPASGASNTSSLDNPVHVYPVNGTYTAQLTVQYDCYSDVIEQVVTIDGYPNLTINGRESICTNESTTLTASGAATYSWSPGANTASISLSPSITTIYTVTGSGTNGACASSKILTVSVLPCTNLLENPLNESVFLIYPNPSNTEVTVEADSDGSVSFINTLGQKVLTQAIHSGKNKLTISDLSLGIYFVIGKTENSEVVLRFVKE